MKKTRVISAIFLAVFLCLSVSAVYAQNDQYETHAQIHSVSLNGQGDYLKIEPGGLIEVEVFYEFRYPYPLPKDISEIVVGFEDTAGICLIDGILDKIPGLTGVFDYSTIFGMIAPTEPGIYHLMRTRTKGYTCHDARELYRENPSTRKIIGTIEVIDNGSGEWKCIYEKVTDIRPGPDFDEYYKIAFYQRENEIRIEINTPDFYEVHSGSVSISVEESIHVYYDTGNVSGVLFGETDYREIKPDPLNVWKEKSFLVLAGLIPGVGFSINVVGYVEAVTDQENAVDRYEEVDLTEDLILPPRDFFEWSGVSNWRDIVVIPWHLTGIIWDATAIRIDCPQMIFSYAGTHDVVFRIDCYVYDQKVRHDIALPIEFASTWATDDLPIMKPRQEW